MLRLTQQRTINCFLNSHLYHLLFWFAIAVTLFLLTREGFATDLLANTTTDATETVTGSIKKYLYIVEGILAVATYIKTKNLLVLPGIAVVAFFMNTVLMQFLA